MHVVQTSCFKIYCSFTFFFRVFSSRIYGIFRFTLHRMAIKIIAKCFFNVDVTEVQTIAPELENGKRHLIIKPPIALFSKDLKQPLYSLLSTMHEGIAMFACKRHKSKNNSNIFFVESFRFALKSMTIVLK